MRKFLSIFFIFSIIFSFFTVANAVEPDGQDKPQSIVMNGIDIGYDDGDYFTKDGKACQNCHGTGICIESDYSCHCMRYWSTGNVYDYEIDLRATQCMGFARYCQWAVYGVHELQDTSKFTTKYKYISGYDVDTVKSELQNYMPATHIRLYCGHSVSVIDTSDIGIQIAEANYSDCCQIRIMNYTWEEFAAYITLSGGIQYVVEFLAPAEVKTTTNAVAEVVRKIDEMIISISLENMLSK